MNHTTIRHKSVVWNREGWWCRRPGTWSGSTKRRCLGLLFVEVVPIAVAFAARPRFRTAWIGDIVDLARGVVLAASGPLEAGTANVERFDKAEVRFWTSEDGSHPSRQVNVGRSC